MLSILSGCDSHTVNGVPIRAEGISNEIADALAIQFLESAPSGERVPYIEIWKCDESVNEDCEYKVGYFENYCGAISRVSRICPYSACRFEMDPYRPFCE